VRPKKVMTGPLGPEAVGLAVRVWVRVGVGDVVRVLVELGDVGRVLVLVGEGDAVRDDVGSVVG